MSAAWVGGALLSAVLLAVAARAAEAVLRSYGRATRWVWLAALVASVALPFAGTLTEGAFSFGLLRGAASPLEVDLEALLSSVTPADAASVSGDATAAGSWSVARVLGATWLAASLLVLLLYGATVRRLRHSRRAWSPARIGETPVYVSERGGPAVVGVLRPSIVVPEWLLSEASAAQRMVVLHESEHVRARDPALLAAAPLLVAAMPWNLPLWWQLRRLRLAVELDCDRRVLARGVAPAAYGTLLLDIAGRRGPMLIGAAAIAAPRTFLERRILAMSGTIPRFRLPRALALVGAAGFLALIACEATSPTNTATPQPRTPPPGPVAVAETPADLRAVALPGDPLILVDGVVVSENVMRALDPERIDHIEVLKGAAAVATYGEAARNGVILITTRDPSAPASEPVRVEEAARITAGRIEETRAASVATKVTQATAVREGVKIDATKVEAVLVKAEAREATATVTLKEGGTATIVKGVRTTTADPDLEVRPKRGLGLLSRQGENQPLIFIDGVLANDTTLDELVVEDIERIEVLKGAAAVAVYGEVARNGVINIMMKR